MLEHRHLRYLVAVAEELDFSKAAEQLHTAQPSLSFQIRNLEEIVGTPLFYRTKRHVELTEAGRIFLRKARALLRYSENAVDLARRAARGEAGHISIGFLPGIEAKIFPRLLSLMQTRYPEVELSLQDLTSPEQLAALENDEIDAGFLRGPITNPEIASEVFLREPIVAVVPESHALAKCKRIPLRSLAALPFIPVPVKRAPAFHDTVDRLAAQAGVHFQPLHEASGILAILNAVATGLGFTLLPDYVRQIAPATVAVRPLDVDPPPEIDLLVAYRKDNKLPARVSFLSLLRECMVGPSPKDSE
jgi:LysR family hca operon transcriptional activator